MQSKRKPAYALTPSRDNIPRVSFTVVYRMTLDDIATLIVAGHADGLIVEGTQKQPDPARITAELSTRRKAMAIATDCLYMHGADTPFYRVGDENLTELKNAVLVRLNTIWGLGSAVSPRGQ